MSKSGHQSIQQPAASTDRPSRSLWYRCTNSLLTLTLVIVLVVVQSWFPIAHAQSTTGSAPNGTGNSSTIDIEPPVIDLEETPTGIAGESQVFTALVADDQALKDVKLYYRYSGQGPFISILMQPLSDTGYYTAKIPTSRQETRSIEYYLQARDQGGNRVVTGYAFDPLIRTLTAESRTQPETVVAAPADTVNTGDQSTQSGGIKWWHIALGVLAAGALAGLAGGSDSGDNSGNGGGVPITLVATPPN